MAKLTREQIVEASRKGSELAAQPSIRIVPTTYETIPDYGHFDVIYPGGSKRFEWDDNKGRRDMSLSVDMTKEQALEAAKEFARKERERLG